MLNTANNNRVVVRLAGLAAITGVCAVSQAQLFSNGSANPLIPALALVNQTGNNTPAPNASQWSEIGSSSALLGNALAGIACHADSTDATSGVRLADDFVVPAGQTWNLTSVQFYAYRPSGVSSPVTNATLRIWNGIPGGPGNVVVFGDTTTNRFSNADVTNAYRVFTTTVGPAITSPDTSRRIYNVNVALNTTLQPGTYWLDWQFAGATANTPIYVVPVTQVGVRTLAAWNARQFADGVWTPVLDTGKPDGAIDAAQDVAFILAGTAGVACDSIDFNRNGTFPEDQDVSDFFNVLAGEDCPYAGVCDIDFNNNQVFPEDQDVIDFFTTLAGGDC